MRPGKVATIRLNPKDCMAVLDICNSAGIAIPGGSFAQHVSLAMSSLLQTMRDAGFIPERDGFEYSEMMEPFGGGNNPRKHAVSETIHRGGSALQVKGLSKPKADVTFTPVQTAPPKESKPHIKVTMEMRDAQRRLSELMQKRDLADTPGTGIVWSASDEDEFQKCYHVVYPDG